MKSFLNSALFDKVMKYMEGVDKKDPVQELTKKEHRAFRKYLRRLLSNHDAFKKQWVGEARRLNRLGSTRRLLVGERAAFSSIMRIELAMIMAAPIRRSLNYSGFARKAFKVEAIPNANA